MPKIHILVVDDSVVIRRLVSDVLSGDPALEVVSAAANGRIALAKIPQVNPDLITLDVEMPEMDGLETLREIRKVYPRLPVIMFSTVTERGAGITLDALALGASDYVTKPANVGSVSAGMQRIRDELIPKIKALCSKVGGFELTRPPLQLQDAECGISRWACEQDCHRTYLTTAPDPGFGAPQRAKVVLDFCLGICSKELACESRPQTKLQE